MNPHQSRHAPSQDPECTRRPVLHIMITVLKRNPRQSHAWSSHPPNFQKTLGTRTQHPADHGNGTRVRRHQPEHHRSHPIQKKQPRDHRRKLVPATTVVKRRAWVPNNRQTLLTREQYDCPKRKLKTKFTFWPDSRRGVPEALPTRDGRQPHSCLDLPGKTFFRYAFEKLPSASPHPCWTELLPDYPLNDMLGNGCSFSFC